MSMNYILFDEAGARQDLLPFTFTRPISELRIGILTIREKWERHLETTVSYHTEAYLREKFPERKAADSVYINGRICPDANLVKMISSLKPGMGIIVNDIIVAFRAEGEVNFAEISGLLTLHSVNHELLAIRHLWDIFSKNGEAVKRDFELLTKGRTSQPLSKTNTVIGDPALVFLEPGAVAEAAIFNTKEGPVYLAKGSEVMEQCAIRGPFALGDHSMLKLSAKVYGPTTIGPHCKVGGEVSNSVIFGYSNKAHDGFLGNSVLGEWCNLGADSNNSNLKNNYGHVKLYSYATGRQEDTGLQFCGLMMGDHSKCGINTMFNTGTVVGVGANVFGGGFPPTHVPSFSWGGGDHFEAYRLDKMFETTEKVFARRHLPLTAADKAILTEVSKHASSMPQP